MYTYKYGGIAGTAQHVEIADDMIVVRTKDNSSLDDSIQSAAAKNLLNQLLPVANFPEAGVTVLQCKQAKDQLIQQRDQARALFKQESGVRFAGRVLKDASQNSPVVYTENLFVKFKDNVSAEDCRSLVSKFDLTIKKELKYATNAYFVSAKEGTGTGIFQIATHLLNDPSVELCHPELIRELERRAIAPQQWHLRQTTIDGISIDQHVNVETAWSVSKGNGIVIAIVDDGVDIDHEEFASPGKIVAPRDVSNSIDNPSPKDEFYTENHGTACAGVACANGSHHASGVAPEAKLMPIRLVSNLGSQAEAEAFVWAADNGADIISCSWGPQDGKWWFPNDPTHHKVVALPDSTRLAIDYAVAQGRNGKGCVITWAAGNGNENVENDGYASYERVIAVAACNDRGKRSVYSDYGASVWCTFPSSDQGHEPFGHPEPLTAGIWTTDRKGQAGYNAGDYATGFGGTSSACPGIAGIAALILGTNPNLRWDEVKAILREAAVKIDDTSGNYNNQGHSPFYGYGRPDAATAVQLAQTSIGGNADIDSDNNNLSAQTLRLAANADGQLDATGSERLYAIQLTSKAKVILDGPDARDFDLYIKRELPPTTTSFDQRAWTESADEALTIEANHDPGTYYILVRSYQGTGSFTLKVELD